MTRTEAEMAEAIRVLTARVERLEKAARSAGDALSLTGEAIYGGSSSTHRRVVTRLGEEIRELMKAEEPRGW